MDDPSYRKTVNNGDIKVVGPKAATRNIFTWMNHSIFADIPPVEDIQ
ncbi:MAG: hypothetical protein OEX19_08085 [Gammaproteobacteria bacterium]|nr:hypothetical protein [Gammaproteobacteria bacterium]